MFTVQICSVQMSSGQNDQSGREGVKRKTISVIVLLKKIMFFFSSSYGLVCVVSFFPSASAVFSFFSSLIFNYIFIKNVKFSTTERKIFFFWQPFLGVVLRSLQVP